MKPSLMALSHIRTQAQRNFTLAHQNMFYTFPSVNEIGVTWGSGLSCSTGTVQQHGIKPKRHIICFAVNGFEAMKTSTLSAL